MMKHTQLAAALTLPLAMMTNVQAATSGSHYSLGGEGVEAGTPPPPGMHYRLYNTWYDANTLTDDRGDNQNLDFNLEVFAQAHRFVNVTDTQILGANWAYNLIVPVIDKQIAIEGVFDASSHFEVGDIVIEPLALFWFNPRFDAILAIAAIAPTGDYSSNKPESVGYGYWSGMITAGGTYFFDDERSWSFSTLSRTLWHGHQDNTGIRPGAEFCLEGGVGKNVTLNDRWLLRPGINYAAGWQISDDSKDGPGSHENQRKRTFGLGAELNAMYLPWLLQANLRFLNEFETRNTSEGTSISLTFTKSF